MKAFPALPHLTAVLPIAVLLPNMVKYSICECSPLSAAGDWKIWIATEEEASQADEIVLWVYGDQANSGPIILWTGEDNGQFLAGNDDEFKVGKYLMCISALVH